MEWKEAQSRLERLTERITPPGNDAGAPFAEALRLIVEGLDHLHQEGIRFEARLEELASRFAALEARVHEDVE